MTGKQAGKLKRQALKSDPQPPKPLRVTITYSPEDKSDRVCSAWCFNWPRVLAVWGLERACPEDGQSWESLGGKRGWRARPGLVRGGSLGGQGRLLPPQTGNQTPALHAAAWPHTSRPEAPGRRLEWKET